MRLSSPHPVLTADRGCVVSYCPVASSIGSRILQEGGNAIDAAVATALALAVTYPQAGNLGGGGFLLYRQGAEAHFLDYRETAPRRAREEDFAGEGGRAGQSSVFGARAIGVPGTVAGLGAALERFGTFDWARVVTPAIAIAERGFWLTTRQAAYFDLHYESLARFASTRRCLTAGDGPLLPGTLFCQPELAHTLRRLADDGPRAFYEGELADRIVSAIAREGGLLSVEDLAEYAPKWRAPIRRRFLDREVITAPLPSVGGLCVQLALGLLEPIAAARRSPLDEERLFHVARALRVVFAEGNRLAGDPDHLDAAELAEVAALLDRRFAAGDLERMDRALTDPAPAAAVANGNTTHFCVLDGKGGAVSNTYSLNTLFGSKLAVEGFLLNNVLDDFLIASAPNWYDLVHGDRNRLRPGRRPVSSMSPTIVTSDGTVELIVGGSGGPRIPSLVVQIILSMLGTDDRMTLDRAVRAPRIHHQYVPATLAVEESLPEPLVAALSRKYAVQKLPLLGIGAGIHRNRATGRLTAALDSRFSFE